MDALSGKKNSDFYEFHGDLSLGLEKFYAHYDYKKKMSFIRKKKPFFSYKPFKTNKQKHIEFVHENLVTFFE